MKGKKDTTISYVIIFGIILSFGYFALKSIPRMVSTSPEMHTNTPKPIVIEAVAEQPTLGDDDVMVSINKISQISSEMKKRIDAAPDGSVLSPEARLQMDEISRKLADLKEKQKVFVVKDEHYWTAERDWDYLRGRVKNNSSHTISYWKVSARYYNDAKDIIDTGYTNALETLPPGASKRFEISHRRTGDIKSAAAAVTEVQFAD